MSVIIKSGASTNTANVSSANALLVDGSAVTQPVSIAGTVPISAAAALSVNVANSPTVAVSGTVAVSASSNLPVAVSGTVPVSVAATLPVSIAGTVAVSASSNLPVSVSNSPTVLISGTVPVSVAATLPVSIAGVVSILNSENSNTASACASTSVGTSSASILAANSARKQCTVVNTNVNVVYLGLGQTPTTSAYHIALSPCSQPNDGTGGTYVSDMWIGAINAIGAVAGNVVVTELT